MDGQVVLQNLQHLALKKLVMLKGHDVKAMLEYVKRLEHSLAEALRLANGNKRI